MKKPILVALLLLIIAAAGAETVYFGWKYWWNREVREEMRDKIVFRAEIDLIIGLTACSAEMTNNYRFKPIGYEISEPSEGS